MQSTDIYSGSIDHSRKTWWCSQYYFLSEGNAIWGMSDLCTDTVSNDKGGIQDLASWKPRSKYFGGSTYLSTCHLMLMVAKGYLKSV